MNVSQFSKLFESVFWNSLQGIDELHAKGVRESSCERCSDPNCQLHIANYPRKPRGVDTGSNEEHRHSFCGSICRLRTTPASVRFLGRKVYPGVVILLISYLRRGKSKSLKLLKEHVRDLWGLREVTIRRWLIWWRDAVSSSPFWKANSGMFMPPLEADNLAGSLYERYETIHKPLEEMIKKLLNFLSPLTIPSEYPS